MPITAPEHLNFELHSLSRTVGCATTTGHSTYFWSFHSTHSMGTLYLRGHSPWTGDTAPVVPAPWTSCFIFWVPVSSSGKMREDWRVEPHMLKLQPLWLTWAFRKCTALPQLHLERKSPSLDAGPSWLRLWPGHLALTQDANSTSSRGDYHRQREQTQVKLSCFKIQPQDQFGPKLIDLWRIISCQCRVGMIKPEMGASSLQGTTSWDQSISAVLKAQSCWWNRLGYSGPGKKMVTITPMSSHCLAALKLEAKWMTHQDLKAVERKRGRALF